MMQEVGEKHLERFVRYYRKQIIEELSKTGWEEYGEPASEPELEVVKS